MKKIEQYISGKPVALITEHIIKGHLKKRFKIKYRPKTKDELIEAIKTELDKGNTDLNCINTSEITNLHGLFAQEAYLTFKPGIKLTEEQQKTLDVSEWNTNNVTDMSHLFRKCNFITKLDLSKWNVSNVKDMSFMFSGLTDLTTLGNIEWDVSNVKNMRNMFGGCFELTKINNIDNWQTKSLKQINNMFYNCTKLVCNLNKWDMSQWNGLRDDTFKNWKSTNIPSWYKT